jgi:hypothetical protein
MNIEDTDEIINPLLKTSFNNTYYDQVNDKIINITINNIFLYYKKIYFLVKKNNNHISFDFYQININKELYNNISQNLILYEINTINFKNQKHLNNILLISKKDLAIFNIFNYNLEDNNLIIPILNISFLNILSYLNQYDNNNTLSNLFNNVLLNEYFNNSSNNDITNSILNLKESNYWKNDQNLFLNLTKKFKNTNFIFNSARVSTININKIFINNDENYLFFTDNKKYIDIATIINDDIYKINDINYNNDDINKLFNSLDDNNKFLLFCQLTISKDYCNLVINNKYILTIMKPFFNKYPHIIRYILSYAWIKLYSEECIKKIDIKESDIFIFDIETASLLPLFPYNCNKPKLNPYMPILISDKVLKSNRNFNGIYDYYDNATSPTVSKGICNLEEFKYRMNIFCTGNSNNDLFEDVNFQELDIGITGSIMTACLQKYHPLIIHFYNKNEQITDKTYNKYFDEYYARSDIDIMFKKITIIEFLKKSNILYNQIIKNILKFNNTAVESDIQINMNKVAYLFIDPNYVLKNINIPNITKKNLINYINNNINNEEIKVLFKPLYEQLKNEYHRDLLNNLEYNEIIMMKQKYPQLFIYDNIDIIIYINYSYKNNTNIVFNYKFKITSKFLKRPLELFQIKYDNFFAAVSQFHVPCVRSYYTGNNVYMTPSCISAHMTFMNIDNKYVASKIDPLHILLKYRSRGFGAWLSLKQLKVIYKYCSNIPYWNNLYIKPVANKIGAFNNILMSPLELDNMCFFPKHNNKEYFLDLEQYDYSDKKTITNCDDHHVYDIQSLSSILKLRYYAICNDDIMIDKINNLEVINSNGYINKPQTWIFYYINNL